MKNAIRVRKVLGGGMRQVGLMAGCGLYALKNNVERLKLDNEKARQIGEKLSTLDYIKKVEPVETNIVIFYLNNSIEATVFQKYMDENHVVISNMGEGKWRLVTHLDYTDKMHTRFFEILQDFRVEVF